MSPAGGLPGILVATLLKTGLPLCLVIGLLLSELLSCLTIVLVPLLETKGTVLEQGKHCPLILSLKASKSDFYSM